MSDLGPAGVTEPASQYQTLVTPLRATVTLKPIRSTDVRRASTSASAATSLAARNGATVKLSSVCSRRNDSAVDPLR
jgi:hypothetical protein